MDDSEREILLKVARGEISLMHATDDLGYQDAGYTLRALAREGLTPYQLPDMIVQEQAIAGIDALRAALKPLRRVTARITRREGEELVATFPWGVEAMMKQPISDTSRRKLLWDNAVRAFNLNSN